MLSLPDHLHKRLADEFRLAATQMVGTANPSQNLFYFPVFFGESSRVLNWHRDGELALIWAITQFTQSQAAARLRSTQQGEPVALVSKEFFDALTESAVSLADYVEKKGTVQKLHQIFGRFSELCFATTGNGFYLLQKGLFNFA